MRRRPLSAARSAVARGHDIDIFCIEGGYEAAHGSLGILRVAERGRCAERRQRRAFWIRIILIESDWPRLRRSDHRTYFTSGRSWGATTRRVRCPNFGRE